MDIFGEQFGADPDKLKNSHVSIFVPSQTRTGEPVDHEEWVKKAIRKMSTLFGGATSLESTGGWLDPESSDVLVEKITIVFSFISEREWNTSTVAALQEFLYRMGRETQQGAIGIVVDGNYREIPSDRYET